jgi:hypothetical protein
MKQVKTAKASGEGNGGRIRKIALNEVSHWVTPDLELILPLHD